MEEVLIICRASSWTSRCCQPRHVLGSGDSQKGGKVTPHGLRTGHLPLLALPKISSARVIQLQTGSKAFCEGWKARLSSEVCGLNGVQPYREAVLGVVSPVWRGQGSQGRTSPWAPRCAGNNTTS